MRAVFKRCLLVSPVFSPNPLLMKTKIYSDVENNILSLPYVSHTSLYKNVSVSLNKCVETCSKSSGIQCLTVT